MNAEQLLQHFERISEAPDAIKRLRRFILDLAVRGKLVEQDPSEEPAAELLKRIAAENLEVEDLPQGWRKAKIGSVLNFQYGKGLKASERLDKGPVPVFGSNGIVGYTDDPLTVCPSIIIGRKGSAGALNICDGPSWTTDVAYFVEAPSFLTLRFLLNVLASIDLDKLGKGVKPGLSRSEAYEQIIPLPPLAEQHRIVAKVDELMNLCDQLEAAKAEREQCRDNLVAASLQGLNQPAVEEETFREHARFTFANLPRITTRTSHIKQLRQTILNLAVRGKLVEQDPSDEPATELLKRIAAEKAKMVKAGDIKTKKICEPSMAEATYLLPSTWKWVALESVFDYDAGIKTEPKKLDQNLWLLELEDVEKDTGRLVERVRASERTSQSTKSEFKINDILYGKLRPYLNKVLLADEQGYSTTEIVAIRPYIPLCSKYCVLALRRPDFLDYVTRLGQGTKMPRLRTEDAKVAPFPLPPLAEQQRIVAKVDELMAICDQLEAQITATEQDSRRFLESVLADALAPGIDLREVAEVA